MKAKKICADAMVLPYRLCFIGKQKSDDLAKRLIAFLYREYCYLDLVELFCKKLFCTCKLNCCSEHVGCNFKLVLRRECRSNSDV